MVLLDPKSLELSGKKAFPSPGLLLHSDPLLSTSSFLLEDQKGVAVVRTALSSFISLHIMSTQNDSMWP